MHASSINHSCLPNISRSYNGDMMILRAAKDLSKGQELLFYYTDPTQPYTTRKKFLSGYGFECGCQLCNIEKCETDAKMTAWEALECEFSKEFLNAGPVAFEKFQTITTKMIEITQHWHDCPRLKIIEPLSVLIEMAFRSKASSVVLDTSRHLLNLLGFRLEITNKKFQVQKWGFVTDTVLICIAEMLTEFSLQHPPSSFCAQVESFLKTAYEIVLGERASYEDTYGKGQLLSRRKGSGKLDEGKINKAMKELTGDE